ncbi:mannonate dehydratase [Sulfitobacter albidus]|uniref:Mannonate dehydratase n=1 Tax=Sulfitobacter albidus TaxID=2829501 RepID=A0A975JGM9_9RHOB|nr:mannonate dehydratase [Sulfitobacter albidus]QUJ78174.1 mannonate dehydratase [Sulfitobacter albidus]
MKQCWRWFGPDDPIALRDLHQVGVEGIVTALHQFPPGVLWSGAAIDERQQELKAAGFRWDVVESLPVSEAIKTQGPDMAPHVDAYCESLHALAARDITTVCYNFMPILDWTRTDLRAPQPHGGTAMAFDLVDFAVFDIHILERAGAAESYPEALLETVSERNATLTDAEKLRLCNNITAGLPGANDTWSLEDVRALLATYQGITAERLRANLIDFLSEVTPTAQALGMRLCCHPDDPPFSLLGLPRVMSDSDDYAAVLEAVDLPANGATLCTGSLGVARDFDGAAFVRRHGSRIHFAHLRNTRRITGSDTDTPDFFEAPHLEGDTDMVATVAALMAEQHRRRDAGRRDWQIPMRPDHGQELLGDLGGHSTPGYPLIGRMRGLAELRGIMAACA